MEAAICVSIPYGAIRRIYGWDAFEFLNDEGVSIPYGAIRRIYVIAGTPTVSGFKSFNPLRGNPADLPTTEEIEEIAELSFNPLRGNPADLP